ATRVLWRIPAAAADKFGGPDGGVVEALTVPQGDLDAGAGELNEVGISIRVHVRNEDGGGGIAPRHGRDPGVNGERVIELSLCKVVQRNAHTRDMHADDVRKAVAVHVLEEDWLNVRAVA